MLENGEKRKQHDVQLDRQARQRLQITKREQGKIITLEEFIQEIQSKSS